MPDRIRIIKHEAIPPVRQLRGAWSGKGAHFLILPTTCLAKSTISRRSSGVAVFQIAHIVVEGPPGRWLLIPSVVENATG
jgi:hypothetical protein